MLDLNLYRTIRIRNRSIGLGTLLKDSLKRMEDERRSRQTTYYPPSTYTPPYNRNDENPMMYNSYKGTIYFYEWSDLDRIPMKFNSIADFEGYLRFAQIPPLEKWQKDMIFHMCDTYAACGRGCKTLLIRSTKTFLKDALEKNMRLNINNTIPSVPAGGNNELDLEVNTWVKGLLPCRPQPPMN